MYMYFFTTLRTVVFCMLYFVINCVGTCITVCTMFLFTQSTFVFFRGRHASTAQCPGRLLQAGAQNDPRAPTT